MADAVVSTTAAPTSLPAEEEAASLAAAATTKDEAKAVNGTDKSAAASKEDNRLSNGDFECSDSLVNGKTKTESGKGAPTVAEKQHCSSSSNNVSTLPAGKSDSVKVGDTSSKQEVSVSDKSIVGNEAVDGSICDTKSASFESSKENSETNGKVKAEDSNGSAKKSDNSAGEDKIKPKEGVKEIIKNCGVTSEGDSKVAEDKEVTEVKCCENKGEEDDDDKSNSGESPSKTSKPESVDLTSGTDESSAKKASDSTDNDTPKKKKKKKLSAVEEDGTPKETRRSSRQRKPVSYVDDVKLTPKDATADTSKGGGGSDIEMIEEGDPLAISDADVKKAQQRDKMGSNTQPQNVIVIDTNTLLRNQGNLAAAVAHQRPSSSSTASSMHQLNQQINNHSITLTQHTSHQQQQAISNAAAAAQAQQHQQHHHQQQQQHQQQHASQQLLQNAAQNVSSVGGTLNIGGINLSAAAIANNPAALQNAIAAITGGANAPPGLKNAYITAVQQVLVQQQAAANTTPAGQQYLANLQQYYNTLGALRDEAYVIEAPSFIVPYVMEGKPKESIKDFLKRTNKEHEECEKKEKKEKEEKEKEEKEKKDLEEKEKTGKESNKAKDSEKNLEKKTEDKKENEKIETDKREKDQSRGSDAIENGSAKKDEKEDKCIAKEDREKVKEDKEEDEKKEESIEDSKVEKTEDGSTVALDAVKKNAAVASDENKENTEGKDKDKEDDKVKEAISKPVVEEDANLDKYKNDDYSHLGRWEGYYKSSLGAFVLDLGLSLAQEFIQADLLKMQKRKLDKMKTQPSRQDISAVKALDRQLSKSREKNVHLRLPSKLCKFCNYRTDSKLVMDRHLESPHMVNYTYKCNFCPFETRGPQVILFHMEAEHMVRGRLERAPAFFQCQLCPFEDNNKSKMTRHSFSCAKKFKPEKNCEMLDWEPPAKIPKQMTRGRTLPVGSNIKNIGGNLYDASGRSLLPKGLPPGLTMQQLQTAVAQGLLPNPNAAANAANNLNRGRGRPIGSYKSPMPGPGGVVPPRPMGPGGAFNRGPGAATPQLSQQQQLALAGQLFQGMQAGKGLKSGQTPSISITALPRAGGASTAGAAAANLGATATGVKTATGKDGKPSFVICEICDGYIKDLEQLRNHMNFIHKVKIHPKMIYNRPPLNCQKCQHRFFTDQGLERHLLGTHGLVTSSMQEAANKSKDAGRCPICGKVFQWKLLNHVARDHKMTLKPAHLSYKCTVCTATFNMYRLFENHVYSAHSVVNKQKENSGPGQSKTNGSAEAPLKINDEITIIPQPSSGKSSSSGQRLLEKKKDGSPATVSKEITITKVGTAPIVNRSSASRNSSSGNPAGTAIKAGSSVEVISLDESPAKKAAAIAMATKRLNTPSADSMAGPSKKSKLA